MVLQLNYTLYFGMKGVHQLAKRSTIMGSPPWPSPDINLALVSSIEKFVSYLGTPRPTNEKNIA
jgi:hypothetical protein